MQHALKDKSYGGNFFIYYSNFVNNKIAFSINYNGNEYSGNNIFNYCNFINNWLNIDNSGGNDQTYYYNYWGTRDECEIEHKIKDWIDGYGSSVVSWVPYINKEIHFDENLVSYNAVASSSIEDYFNVSSYQDNIVISLDVNKTGNNFELCPSYPTPNPTPIANSDFPTRTYAYESSESDEFNYPTYIHDEFNSICLVPVVQLLIHQNMFTLLH